jgi:hypothetical protein
MELAYQRAQTEESDEDDVTADLRCSQRLTRAQANHARDVASMQGMSNGQDSFRGSLEGKHTLSCVIDLCEAGMWPAQPAGKTYLLVLWQNQEVSWEEWALLQRGMGKATGLSKMLAHAARLYEIRGPRLHKSKTLMGYDIRWMPKELTSPRHNHGRDLSAEHP